MEPTQNERSSVLSRYFAEIREYPLLTKEEEISLAANVAAAASQTLEKARAEEALRQSEERLKVAMEAAGLTLRVDDSQPFRIWRWRTMASCSESIMVQALKLDTFFQAYSMPGSGRFALAGHRLLNHTEKVV